jgi:hypothetical protein
MKQEAGIPAGMAGVTFPLFKEVVMSHPFRMGQRLIAWVAAVAVTCFDSLMVLAT